MQNISDILKTSLMTKPNIFVRLVHRLLYEILKYKLLNHTF